MSIDIEKLRALYEAGARGTWSWEDGPPTLYAGRVDQIGEIGGYPMFGHGLNLLGRLEPDSNGKAVLDLIVAAVNALPSLLDALDALHAKIAELEGERDEARKVAQDLSWMARRYADGRRSYAVGMCNDALRKGYEGGWIHPICNGVDGKWARDGDELFERMAQDDRARLARGEG